MIYSYIYSNMYTCIVWQVTSVYNICIMYMYKKVLFHVFFFYVYLLMWRMRYGKSVKIRITFLNSSYIPHVSCNTELWICIFTCTCFVSILWELLFSYIKAQFTRVYEWFKLQWLIFEWFNFVINFINFKVMTLVLYVKSSKKDLVQKNLQMKKTPKTQKLRLYIKFYLLLSIFAPWYQLRW